MKVSGDCVELSAIRDPVGLELEYSRYLRACYSSAAKACGLDMGTVSTIILDDIGIPIYGIPVVPREPNDPRRIAAWQENMEDVFLALKYVQFPRLEDGETIEVMSIDGVKSLVRSNVSYAYFEHVGEPYWYLTTTTLRKSPGIVAPPFSPLSSRKLNAPERLVSPDSGVITVSLSIYAAEIPDFRGRREDGNAVDDIETFIDEARKKGIAPISDPSAVIAEARLIAREKALGTKTTGGFSKKTATAFARAVPALEKLARKSFDE
mgnify:CR=1 FL=1